MKYWLRPSVVLIAALSLGACSGGDQAATSLVTEAALAVKSAVSAQTTPRIAVPPGAVPQGLSRAAIADVKAPMVLVAIEALGSNGTLLKTGENRGYVTWVSQDRLTLTTKGGVVSATRGLANDLLAGDADPTLAALRAGGAAAYSKEMRHIGGDRQIEIQRLTCQMAAVGSETVVILERSHATRHFAETCQDAAGASQRNDYWLGSNGTIWRSRQFLHPASGYIEVRRLIE